MTGKVLQVITDRDRRGAQVFATDLEAFFVSKGLDVDTVALWQGTSEKKLAVRALSEHRGGLGFFRPLQAEMRHADIVIAHGSRTLMASAVAGLRVPIPVVYRQISDLTFWAGGPLRSVRVRAYLRRMSHVVTLWTGAARVLQTRFGVPHEKISIIPNGAPTETFQPPTPADRQTARRRFGLVPSDPVVLCVSALVPEKGVALALKALGRMPQARLLVVGDGPQLRELQSLADDLCPGRVIFAGPLDDVLVAYHAADVLLLPSCTEVMPAVVIEAGLCGIPVVATRVGAIPTMVRGGATGFLVDHDPGDIASGIATALKGGDMGVEARKYCLAHYALDHVGTAWLAVLETETGASLTGTR